MNINDMAPPSGESFRFEQIGDTVRGVLVYVPSAPETRTNKFTGREEGVVKLVLVTDDGDRAIYPVVGTAMARAIGEAVRAAGAATLEVGGTLAVKFSEELDTGKPSKMKIFAAKYEPAKVTAAIDVDLF